MQSGMMTWMSDSDMPIYQDLTLLELLTAAEHSRRRIIEHLQFDLSEKSRTVSEGQETQATSLIQSGEYAVRLIDSWDACCAEILHRLDSILDEA